MSRNEGRKLIGFFAGALAFAISSAALGADPLADAVHFFVFDRDLNGDGLVQQEELRDVRWWGSTNFNGYAKPSAPSVVFTENTLGRASWSHIPVTDPARGLTRTMDALSLRADLTNDGSAKSQSQRIDWQTGAIKGKGDITVLARVRFESFAREGITVGGGTNDRQSWFLLNGHKPDWSSDGQTKSGGTSFGFVHKKVDGRPATDAYPIVRIGRVQCPNFYANGDSRNIPTPDTPEWNALKVTTNVWYDIAWTIERGAARATGGYDAKWTVLIRDADPDERLTDSSDYTKRRTRDYRYKEGDYIYYNHTEGAFYNEDAYASDKIYLGADGNTSAANGGGSVSADINRLVMWNRALTTNELLRVMMQDSMTFRVGVEDGSNGEFGDVAETPSTYTVDGAPWHELPKSVSAANPSATLSFTPHSANVSGLAYVLRVKAAAGDGGSTILDLNVNGTKVGRSHMIKAGGETSWNVPAGTLMSGANTIAIVRDGRSSASALSIDMVEMGGSWGVGVANGSNTEFSHEDTFPNPHVFYPGDWNFWGCQQGITGSRSLNLRFYVSESLAGYGYVYSGRVINSGNGNSQPTSFKVLLNGVEKYSTGGSSTAANTQYSFEIAPGELAVGWNTVSTVADDKSTWMTLDHHTLSLTPVADTETLPGLTMIVF